MILAVAVHPELWVTALRQVRRTARVGWWRRSPFVPLPAADYLGFRLSTQYGDATHRPERSDVVDFLRWCKQWDRSAS